MSGPVNILQWIAGVPEKQERKPERNVTWRQFTDKYLKFPFAMAKHHEEVWEWAENLKWGKPSDAVVLCLARGGAKSSTAEAIIPFVGERGSRKFALYVSGTQAQADKHLSKVRDVMESAMGLERKTTKYGMSGGWTASMLRVNDGFSVLAVGLDVAVRGLRLGDFRPDLIILDDIDDQNDSYENIQSKLDTIKTAILPSMASHGAVAFVQNVIHANSIMQLFLDNRNDFLLGAKVIGPIPAAYALQYELDDKTNKWKVFSGVPTWEGQGLSEIEHQINQWGLRSFLRESQHEVHDQEGALWSIHQIYGDSTNPDDQGVRVFNHEVPAFKKMAIGVDPAVTNKVGSDESGIVVAALGFDDVCYVIDDMSGHYSPGKMADLVYRMWGHYEADAIVIEMNQGGDFVEQTFLNVDPTLPIVRITAHEGKKIRAQPVAALYEDGRVKHVMCPDKDGLDEKLKRLELQMTTWDPEKRGRSPDRIDALVMAITHLMEGVMNGPGRGRSNYRK